jgi:Flp pilus assembly protein TadG
MKIPRSAGGIARKLRSAEAAAIMEFAVALPLLMVMVVGIFDFGGAFNLKQELNNAAREGARFGSTEPTNDLGSSAPPTVDAIRDVVDSYLKQANINECGILGATAARGGNFLIWTYNASTNCPGTLQLIIQRDYPGAGNQSGGCYSTTENMYVLCTQVTISYPYQWHFNNVIQLLVPGSHLALTNIQTQATTANTN